MRTEIEDVLEILGLETSEDSLTRSMEILKLVLNLYEKNKAPLSFAEIFETVNEHEKESEFTRAWVHRLLKNLVDKGLIQIDGEGSSRRHYICDINTLIYGLRIIKSKQIDELNISIRESTNKIENLQTINTNLVAQKLYEKLTGRPDIPGSRYLQGLVEFHEVTDETIYKAAKSGDTIRSIVIDSASFLERADDRLVRIFTAAASGVLVKYAVSADSFSIDRSAVTIPDEWISKFIGNIFQMQGKGLDFRVLQPGIKRYQFASLNSDVLALVISDKPMTAAWVNRDSNADMIDSAIDSFEQEWESAIPLTQLTPDILLEWGLPKDNFIVNILMKSRDVR